MSSSVKSVLEENLRGVVQNVVSGYSSQLSNWLREHKDVEVSPEELCAAFEVPFKTPQTPGGVPSGAQISTIMPNLPNYYAGSGVTTPKKKGGRAKKTVDNNLPTCSYVMARGQNVGKQCNNSVVGDGVTQGGDKYCKACLKKAAVKSSLEGNTSKSSMHAPSIPGSTVEIPSSVASKNDELQVVAIPGQEGRFREVHHGFIVEQTSDGSVTAIAIDDNDVQRDLRPDERAIALSLGINVVNIESVSLPTVVPKASGIPSIPQVPQIPNLSTVQVPKS